MFWIKRKERKMRMIALMLVFVGCAAPLLAQVPTPAGPQTKPIALVGGVAHLGNGQVIENAVISFDKGKLTSVGARDSVQLDASTHDIVDVSGKHIYPGLILPASTLGLAEVSSIRAMSDDSEAGSYNPNVRAIVSYNTDSEFIPTLRYNGILIAQSAPTDGVVSGTSSIVQLDAWNWEDAAFKTDDGIHVSWPSRMSRRFDLQPSPSKPNPTSASKRPWPN